ncbi:hypothetical protein EII34_02880 [Arachnia propionica]|uniref:Uncharacterized protein n=1 Tax=Arachnia propionica TaxID=1750 RepID=A0A3P1TAX0_9ACTN|nr:hypothetical protein [Arachnia propionica]RRD06587.1 hypothetical protein EII34_02880 [Arachnia propionica]
MTALVSLRSRLLLCRLAVTLPLVEAASRLEGLAGAGVDLVVTTSTVDAQETHRRWLELNRQWGRQVLLAHDVLGAGGDVIVATGWPGRRMARPHPYTLLGWRVGDRRSVRVESPHDFLVLDGAAPQLITAAMVSDPPLSPEARPWFVAGRFSPDRVQRLVEVGARRVLLTGTPGLDEVGEISRLLRDSWHADPKGQGFLAQAIRS